MTASERRASGHASVDEQRDIDSRAAALDLHSSPIADLLELALLFLEPAHREDEAITVLETILAREPGNGEAAIWLAYTLLHVRMDSVALEQAHQVLSPFTRVDVFAGAAEMLLAEVADEQGADLAQRIQRLERSVALEPRWVNNRQDLAWAYSEAGRQADAAAQLRQAVPLVRAPDPAWPLRQRAFEEAITGRTAAGAAERLAEDLRELT